jgi:hypothetical protein
MAAAMEKKPRQLWIWLNIQLSKVKRLNRTSYP